MPEHEEEQYPLCANECKDFKGNRWPAVGYFNFTTKFSKEDYRIPLCAHCLLLHTVGEDVPGDGPYNAN